MTVTYRPAAAVERIAKTLIAKHHTDLVDVRIDYVFRSETAKSAGRDLWGKARKISGLNAYLGHASADDSDVLTEPGDDFFVIEISEPVWRVLEEPQRRALVDHELCHLQVVYDDKTEEATLKVRTHDLEEFRAVVRRHGLWRPDVEAFSDALRFEQLSMEDATTVSVNGGPAVPLKEFVDTAAAVASGADAPDAA